MLFRCQNLFIKHRNGASAINNLSFEVEKGEIFAIFSKGEGGKTTLLKGIAGLYNTTGGKLYFNDLCAENIAQKDKNICLLHEDGGFFTSRTVKYNISYPLKIRNIPFRQEKLLFVKNILNKPIRKLSEKEKLSVCMERLNLREASLYLLDDPMKRIPEEDRKKEFDKYLSFILSLTKKGGVLYATSSLDEIKKINATISILHYGYEQQRGSFEELYNEPNSVTVLSLLHENEDISLFPTKLCYKNGELSIKFKDENISLNKENLLNEIYYNADVLCAKMQNRIFVFDEKSEQRIYFN